MAVNGIRKGQFFIIGALLIAALIAGFVLLDIGGLDAPTTQTPKHLFDRSMNEFPVAVNTITADGEPVENMERRIISYLEYQQYLLNSHALQTQSHALISIPENGNVTFVFANFHGTDADDIALTVDGSKQTIDQVPDGQVATFSFDNLPSGFDVRLAFTVEKTFNTTFTTSRHRRSALYRLTVEGESQTWQDTRVY